MNMRPTRSVSAIRKRNLSDYHRLDHVTGARDRRNPEEWFRQKCDTYRVSKGTPTALHSIFTAVFLSVEKYR